MPDRPPTREELAALLPRWNSLSDDERERLRLAVLAMIDQWELSEARRDPALQEFLRGVLRG